MSAGRFWARTLVYLDANLALARCLCARGSGAGPLTPGSPIARDPKNREAHGLLVEVLIHLGQWEAYGTAMGHLISLHAHHRPSRPTTEGSWICGWGTCPRGWARYESRLECPGLIIPKTELYPAPMGGLPFKGKTLLVHYEQGLGDTFMFVRYATRVKALGGRVLLEVPASPAGRSSHLPRRR